MGGFKRFLLFVFSLVGLVTLAILGMPWFGYGARQLSSLLYVDTFWVVLEVCLGMTVCFLLFNMGRALFSRRRDDSITIMSIDGSEVTVSRTAISSQAAHIVEALGVGTAKRVEVTALKKKPVDIDVCVLPYESIDVTAEAPVLHDALTTGLSAMCGERLGNINLEFLEPEHGSSLVVPVDESAQAEAPATDTSAPAASVADETGDITIPMHTEKSE